MNNLTISKKFILIVISVTLVMSIIGFFILNNKKNQVKEEVISNTVSELQKSIEQGINSKLDVGISNAISIANDNMIKDALKTKNRDLAIKALNSLSADMKKSTPFKNIQVHVHTKDNRAFVRSWVLDKFGDDLSSFRASVVEVNKTQKAINTLEVGKAGLSIRSVVPIFSNEGEHLGSLEFMQGINSVAKDFDKNGDGFVLLMDPNLAVADT